MNLQGKMKTKISEKSGVSQNTNKEWKIAEFLLEVPARANYFVCLKVRGADRIAKFEAYIGKDVVVDIGVESHEHNGRWYTEVEAWGVGEYVAHS